MSNVDWSAFAAALGNHLWQSTAFVVIAWILTLVLKNNHARVRHTVWLAASLKFLLPLSLLVSLGSHTGWVKSQAAPSISVINQISEPFTEFGPAPKVRSVVPAAPVHSANIIPFALLALWLAGFLAVVLNWVLRSWRLRALLREARLLTEGREFDSLQRMRLRYGISKQSHIASMLSAVEPGVVGTFRPILLMPAGIANHLDDEQLDSVMAHELCHVERHDNLWAMIQGGVEAVFWFHPLIWLIGSRLIDECESACDEGVLQAGISSEPYAEAILKVCDFYLKPPVPHMSGIGGANLKPRIAAIMSERRTAGLSLVKCGLLATVATATVFIPVLFGAVHPAPVAVQTASAPAFEAATVKENPSNDPRQLQWGCHGIDKGAQGIPVGRCVARGAPLTFLITEAYDIPFSEVRHLVSAQPHWFDSNVGYDVEATSGRPATLAELHLMLQRLLAERFKLVVHREKRELSGFALLVAKGGSKLQEAPKDRDCTPTPGVQPCHSSNGGQGRGLSGRSMTMSELAEFLSAWTSGPIVDKTGLTGTYDVKSTPWKPENPGPNFAAEAGTDPENLPTIFSMVQEQLGLRLEAQKITVDVLVLEHAEKPSGDSADAKSAGTISNLLSLVVSKPAGPVVLTQLSTLTPPPQPFDVASVKINKSGDPGWEFTVPSHGYIRGTNVSLMYVLQVSFHVQTPQIIGAPDWVTSTHLDMEAKGPPSATTADVYGMVRVLLADRFKLATHVEKKELPVYALTIGKGGPKLGDPTKGPCREALLKGEPCGDVNYMNNGLDGINMTSRVLATNIGRVLRDRPVLDETGITSRFDLRLVWEIRPGDIPMDIPVPSAGPSESISQRLDAVRLALQEQAGLKLEPTKGLVEVLVIDRMEPLSGNLGKD